MTKLYNKVEKFVIDAFTKTRHEEQIIHFKKTAYWVKKLEPKSDEALLISAIAHDIERGFRSKETLKKHSYTDHKFLRPHEEEGAEIISKFLKKQGATKELIERVRMLVSRHEEGGNKYQNLLKDADSISFFENNLDIFFRKAKEEGKDKIKQKFDWMYNRITSEKAKKIVKKQYQKAIKDLDKF